MKYKVCGIVLMFVGMVSAETVNKVSVNLSHDEVHAVIAVLQEAVAERAPRLDAPTADSPSYPVTSGDAADLALIKSALCSLTSTINNIVGAVTDEGSCFPLITTNTEIDDAQLSVIAWLKTLMREFRGTCP